MRLGSVLSGACLALLLPIAAAADAAILHQTRHWAGLTALSVFVIAYLLVVLEEFLHVRKSKPVLVASGIIWVLAGIGAREAGQSHLAEEAARHYLLEFGELFLFLLAAMTFINCMDERGVFRALRVWMLRRRFSQRGLFWVTGALAFFLSPVCDNLTTALLMGAVVMSVGVGDQRFVVLGCLNVVVAANAGGAWSPFGDITTLMVWQRGLLHIFEFMPLFLPAFVNWLIPALIMSRVVPATVGEAPDYDSDQLKPGALRTVALFLATIAAAVLFHALLGLPPVLGMMTGLGVLTVYARWLRSGPWSPPGEGFDVYQVMEKSEWDTLLFFFGVIMSVGGLALFGYLELLSQMTYLQFGPTSANIGVGVLSAVVDNIPVMVAVLSMEPAMSMGQWLLVTLTAGVGGSLLSIGSAAGVALMGQARGVYTFASHLRWSWAVALGYAGSVVCHLLINQRLF